MSTLRGTCHRALFEEAQNDKNNDEQYLSLYKSAQTVADRIELVAIVLVAKGESVKDVDRAYTKILGYSDKDHSRLKNLVIEFGYIFGAGDGI